MSHDTLEVFSKDTFLTSLRNAGGVTGSGEAPTQQPRLPVEEPEAYVNEEMGSMVCSRVCGEISDVTCLLAATSPTYTGWRSCETDMRSSTRSLGRSLKRSASYLCASIVFDGASWSGTCADLLTTFQISAVLGRQEKDFLAAYRAHMYNVQKELHDMREKVHRNETVENKTEKIKKIEEERDWYRKEALRLDAFTTSMTKDLKYMKEKLQAIEEDRNWLEKQLKACKKQNKLLRAELDVRIASPANAAAGFENSVLPSFDGQSKGGSTTMSRKQTKRNSETSGVGGFNNGGGTGGLPYLCLEAPPNSPTAVPHDEREEKFKRQIKGLKRELQQKNQELNVLRQRRYLGKEDEQRSHLENFFIQCVESVKEEVARRRHGSGSGNASLDRKQDKTGQRASYADKARNQRYDVGPEFEEFTSADRVRLIERLLAHDEVLTFLYEHLFPSQVAPVSPLGTARSANTEALRDFDNYTSSLSESSVSLPETTSLRSSDPLHNSSTGDPTKFTGGGGNPVGSGAAAASAVRGGGLPLDASTMDYLRSMYVACASVWSPPAFRSADGEAG